MAVHCATLCPKSEVMLMLVFVCVQCWKKLTNPNLATWMTDVRYRSRFQIRIRHSNLNSKADFKGFLVDVACVNLFLILHKGSFNKNVDQISPNFDSAPPSSGQKWTFTLCHMTHRPYTFHWPLSPLFLPTYLLNDPLKQTHPLKIWFKIFNNVLIPMYASICTTR